jgi:hypothetical protein
MPDPPTNHGGKNRCKDLKILYNEGRIFLTGYFMPFEFRIMPVTEGLTDIVIVIRAGGEEVVYEPPWEPDVCEEVDTPIAFRPPQHFGGYQPFNIFVGYRLDDTQHWFTYVKNHWVFSPKDKVGNVVRQLNIAINTGDVKGSEAGDATVHNYIQGLDKLLEHANGTIEDFKGFNLPAVWASQILLKCAKPPMIRTVTGSKPKTPPPPEAVVPGLTLRIGKRRIHFLGASEVTAGRSRDCGIVVRLPYPGGVQPADERKDHNLYISQRHFLIALDKGQAFIRDESSRGTEMDGVALVKGKNAAIPLDRSVALRLAVKDVPTELPHAAFECRVWSVGQAGEGTACPATAAPNEVAAVTLQRRDTPTETFVLLPHRLRLSAVAPGWGDGCVCRHRGGFVLRTGHGCHWLRPGMEESTATGTLAIEAFKQDV